MRAAAWSALRAGFAPIVLDRYADRDLESIATVVKIEWPPRRVEILSTIDELPNCPWLYTGGMENHGRLVHAISRRRRLWGIPATTLETLQDPLCLPMRLERAGLPFLDVQPLSQRVPHDGTWLSKPRRSTGGFDIHPIVGVRETDPSRFAQRRAGAQHSALLIADGESCVHLLGVTRQLIGVPAAPFAYQGTVAPWPVSNIARERIAAVGAALNGMPGLLGLFGVDFVMGDDDVPWPVEINPRYTAAVEALELATGCSLLDLHRRACTEKCLINWNPLLWSARMPSRFVAKGYVFAESRRCVPWRKAVKWPIPTSPGACPTSPMCRAR